MHEFACTMMRNASKNGRYLLCLFVYVASDLVFHHVFTKSAPCRLRWLCTVHSYQKSYTHPWRPNYLLDIMLPLNICSPFFESIYTVLIFIQYTMHERNILAFKSVEFVPQVILCSNRAECFKQHLHILCVSVTRFDQ